MNIRAVALILAWLIHAGIGAGAAQADSGRATNPTQAELLNQANAPISGLFQVRLQDAYAPAFQGGCAVWATCFRSPTACLCPNIDCCHFRSCHC